MTASGSFEEAKNFFSSYFHEDWPEDAQDPAQVISIFLRQGCSAEYLRRLAHEIRQFAARHADDDELEQAFFSELGSYYLPSADNISARIWLQGIASTLEKAAEGTVL
jgi:CdiI immunity protein